MEEHLKGQWKGLLSEEWKLKLCWISEEAKEVARLDGKRGCWDRGRCT